MSTEESAVRLCPFCGVGEPIQPDEAVWPTRWRCRACGRTVPDASGIPMFAPDLADTASGFEPTAFDRLAQIEAKHFWFVARNALIVGLANKYFPCATRYLEIGCGNGAVLKAIASSRRWQRLVGCDLHPSGLAYARTRMPHGIEFAQMRAEAIPAAAAFDLTGAYDVIEHVPDDEAAIRALRAATIAGGGAIIAVPQHPSLWSRADEIGHHQRRYRRGELEAKLERNGFRILFSSSYTVVLFPAMMVSRLKARFWPGNADADIEREVSAGKGVNRIFTALLSGEVYLTLAGIRWPCGGSRIVVARAA
jgi:SAM-dependent methyltransferase